MHCRDVERLEDLSLDGEISTHEQAELDTHFVRCPSCRERAATRRWVRDSIRCKLQASTDTAESPVGLKTRICTEIREESRSRAGGLAWRAALPVSMALGVVAILSWTTSTAPSLNPDETVRRHTRNVLPEVRARGGERDVARYLRGRLGYSVDLPRSPDKHLRLVGARLAHFGDADAAHLMYDHRGVRISVFASPRRGAMAMPAAFASTMVNGQRYLVGRHRGYTVVVTERDDVVYRFVSDVDGPQLVRFASTVHR